MEADVQVVVDLNVIVDVVQKREPFFQQSASLLDAIARQKVKGFVATHSITTLFYMLQCVHSPTASQLILSQLLENFTVAAIDDKLIRQALSWGWKDFEDAVQMAAAVNVNADYFITRNGKDFIAAPVTIATPVEMVALINSSF